MKWFITRWWSPSTGELQNLGNPDALRDCQPTPEAETHKTKGRVWRKGNKKTLTVGIHLFSMINFLFSSVQKISKKKWQSCARGSPFWKTSSWQSQRWYQSKLKIVPEQNSFFPRECTTPSRRQLRERKRKNWRENRSRGKNREGTLFCPKISTLSMTPTFSREARPRASVPTFPGAKHFSCSENSDFILCLDLAAQEKEQSVSCKNYPLWKTGFFSGDILNSTKVLIYLILMRIGVLSNNSEPIIIMLH